MTLKVVYCIYSCTVLLLLLEFITHSEAAVFQPVRLTRTGLQSVNGSDPDGGCPQICVRMNGQTDVCDCASAQEFTNFLVDGVIPELGDLDGDTWASELFTVERTGNNRVLIGFQFADLIRPLRLDVTMFNCLPWDIGAYSITVYTQAPFPVFSSEFSTSVGSITLDSTSCDSLLTFSVPLNVPSPGRATFYIEFGFADTPNINWVHLAEITFTDEPVPTTSTPPATESPTPTSSTSTIAESSSTSKTQMSSTIASTASSTSQPVSSSITTILSSSLQTQSSIIIAGTATTAMTTTTATTTMTAMTTMTATTTMTAMTTMTTTTAPAPVSTPTMPPTLPGGEPQTIPIIIAVLVVIIALLIFVLVCGITAITCFLKASKNKRNRLDILNLQKSILESQSQQKGATILPAIETENNTFYGSASYKQTQDTLDVLGYSDVPIKNGEVVESAYNEAIPEQDENYATISDANDAMKKVQQSSAIPLYTGVMRPEPPPIPEKSESFFTELNDNIPNAQYSTVGHEGTPTPTATVTVEDTSSSIGPRLLRRPLCHSMIDNPDYEASGVALSIFNSTEQLDDLAGIYSEPNVAPANRNKCSGLNINPIYSESNINPQVFVPENTTQDVADEMDVPYASVYALAIIPPEENRLLEVSWDNVHEVQVLGMGFFGQVVLADTIGLSLKDLSLSESIDNKDISLKVAIKKLRGGATKDIKETFEKEYKFMSRLEHSNVIRILGICTSGDTPFIMMEYMEKGDLNQYLQQFDAVVTSSNIEDAEQNNKITVGTLVYIATQIASAMKYLASHNFIHRDLATRNCLVGEEYSVKIADFGMSRSLYESHYYRVRGNAVLPVRWMAKECFYGKFSTKTDVWAFGVLVWEVFMLGKEKPYSQMTDQELIQDAVKGDRILLEKPAACPQEVYEMMLKCWKAESSDRAMFYELLDLLSSLDSSDIFGDDDA